MSLINAKNFFLLVISIVVVVLSTLFAQFYSEQATVSLAAVIIYTAVIIIAAIITWFIAQKIFPNKNSSVGSETITVEELFDYTHDPVTNLPTSQQA